MKLSIRLEKTKCNHATKNGRNLLTSKTTTLKATHLHMSRFSSTNFCTLSSSPVGSSGKSWTQNKQTIIKMMSFCPLVQCEEAIYMSSKVWPLNYFHNSKMKQQKHRRGKGKWEMGWSTLGNNHSALYDSSFTSRQWRSKKRAPAITNCTKSSTICITVYCKKSLRDWPHPWPIEPNKLILFLENKNHREFSIYF